jgi:hypothetical protein
LVDPGVEIYCLLEVDFVAVVGGEREGDEVVDEGANED